MGSKWLIQDRSIAGPDRCAENSGGVGRVQADESVRQLSGVRRRREASAAGYWLARASHRPSYPTTPLIARAGSNFGWALSVPLHAKHDPEPWENRCKGSDQIISGQHSADSRWGAASAFVRGAPESLLSAGEGQLGLLVERHQPEPAPESPSLGSDLPPQAQLTGPRRPPGPLKRLRLPDDRPPIFSLPFW